jgi:perosamine synthetase
MNAKTARIIEHSRPTLAGADETAVRRAIDSGILVGGERLAGFERDLARCTGRRSAVAVTSGSAALHLALAALGMEPGSRVAIPSYACISLLQAVRRADLVPVPVDCDPATFHIDPEDLLRRRTSETKAVIQVHTFGYPAASTGGAYEGLIVIDDIATAIGATMSGRPAGAAGVLTVCSFHATKMITTGSGGAIAGDDDRLMDRIEDLVSYDTRDDDTVRFNERMAEIPAALGRSQIARLPEMLSRRRHLAGIYTELLGNTNVILPKIHDAADAAWYRFVVRIPGGSEPVREHLQSMGIRSPRPVHRPIHSILGLDGYEGAERAHHEALSLPIYPALSEQDARAIAKEVLACPAAT